MDWDILRHQHSIRCKQVWFVSLCFPAEYLTHQLLNNSLHQGRKGDAFALPVVKHVLDQLWDHFGVRFGLKFVSFGDLRRAQPRFIPAFMRRFHSYQPPCHRSRLIFTLLKVDIQRFIK